MKHKMNSLVLAFLFALPFSAEAFVLEGDLPQDGVVINNVVIDKSQTDLKSDHYICLGEGWRKYNTTIHQKISEFNKSHPGIFKDLGENQKNCFSPKEVPTSAQKSLDEILATIDIAADNKLYLTVAKDGGFNILADKTNFFPLCPTGKDSIGASPVFDLKKDLEKFKLRNEDASLGKKLLRAEMLVGGVELIGMGALIALPKSITKWEDDWMQDAQRNLKRAWTQAPVWDKDGFAINYIGHPYAGAIYYNTLRSQGGTRLQSFLFSAFQSTLWEYVVEGIAERPSIQDLFITPVVGSIIGELAHRGTLKMKNGGFTLGEKILVTIINPTYVLNNGFRTTNSK